MGIIMGYARAQEDIKKGDLVAIEADLGKPNDKDYRVGPWDWQNWSISDCDDRMFQSGELPDAVWLSAHPQYGDLFTLEEFEEMRKSGAISDYDGHANFATEKGLLNVMMHPSTINVNAVKRAGFTHIMWYNK